MVRVVATEFRRRFSEYQRLVRREPIEVQAHDQTTGYFISPEDFAEYQRLLAASRQAYHPSELPEHLKHAVANARMDARHDHLNSLLDDE
ncbi:MAG TPA: hypothetical protein VJO12_18580 [Stellaceae bacterium]|nr:hypothetical protein [Stellaceae bacterium]